MKKYTEIGNQSWSLHKGSSVAISGQRIGIFMYPVFTTQPNKLLRSVALIQQSTCLTLSMWVIPFTSFVLLTRFKINKYLCDLLDVALTEPEGKKDRWLCNSMGKNVLIFFFFSLFLPNDAAWMTTPINAHLVFVDTATESVLDDSDSRL